MALRRIMKELQDIDQNDLPPNIQSIAPASDDSFLELYALITGPENTPYAGGNFLLFIEIPQNYPFKRPKLKFETEIYHPNIHETGTLDTRHVGIDDWSPVWTIVKALIMVVERLKDPDTEGRSYGSEVNFEAAHLHRTSRWMYNKRANDMAVKYADAPPQNIEAVDIASISDMKCVYHAKTQQIVVDITLDHSYHSEYENYKDHIKYMSIKIALDDDEEYSDQIEINRTDYSIVIEKELEYGRNIIVKAWTAFDSTEWETLNDMSSNSHTKHLSVPVLEKRLCIALIEGYFHQIKVKDATNKRPNLRKRDLLKLSKPKLIRECKKYKVSTTGSKNDMIQRLLTADAKKPKKTRSKKKSKKTKKKKKKKSMAIKKFDAPMDVIELCFEYYFKYVVITKYHGLFGGYQETKSQLYTSYKSDRNAHRMLECENRSKYIKSNIRIEYEQKEFPKIIKVSIDLPQERAFDAEYKQQTHSFTLHGCNTPRGWKIESIYKMIMRHFNIDPEANITLTMNDEVSRHKILKTDLNVLEYIVVDKSAWNKSKPSCIATIDK
eukprot:511011_1